jgi:RNA ligase
MIKYPRTQHLQGSRLQAGDEDLSQVRLADLEAGVSSGGKLIWEEKVDGANVGISFDENYELMLQSRGHVLRGGPREKQFALLKAWADSLSGPLLEVLTDQYVIYGEWMFAKHTVFYDRLPHYFLEFDVLDKSSGLFLSTAARRTLLAALPLASVPVVHTGALPATTSAASLKALRALIKPSLYKSTDWLCTLYAAAQAAGVDPAKARTETEASDLAEGLYLKHENDAHVIGRYKFVRADFLQAILDSGSHWAERPIIQNQLAPGVDIFDVTRRGSV